MTELQTYFSNYLNYLLLHKYSKNTTTTYTDSFKKFRKFIISKRIKIVQDIDLKLLEKYRYSLIKEELSTATIKMNIAFVKRFFTYLEN